MKFLIISDCLKYSYAGYEQLGFLYILSAVRNAGHDVKMVEAEFDKASKLISEWKPELVGYSVYTGYQRSYLELNRRLKEKHNFISVFGGPHATFFPEMIEEEGVDAICRGEGEDAIVELIELISKGEDYSNVRNFWIRKNGTIHKNSLRPLQTDLGKIAHPARDILYQYPLVRSNRIRLVVTARGCPYACTYCYNNKIKELYKDQSKNFLRFRPVDDVIEEILEIRDNYPLDYVYFGSDCFTASKKWALEFSEKYRQKLNIPFFCTTRPETTTPEVCKALKSANCVTVSMGIESGDEDFRKNLLNRKMTNEQIIKAAGYIHDAGLRLFTFNMLGLPGETLQQALKTLEINQKCKVDYPAVYLFQPFPRTKLAEYAVKNGYFDGNFDQLSKSYYKPTPMKNPDQKKLYRLQKLFWLGTEFPSLTPLIKFLLNLPLAGFFHLFYKMHKAYAYRFRIMPLKLRLNEFFKLVWNYFKDTST